MLIDRPQIVEGSVIVNATVPSGTVNPTSPNIGELFYRTDTGSLIVYSGGVWGVVATTADITTHEANQALHLTAAQNTLFDGLSSSLTAAEINQLVGVTSPIQAQINSVSGTSSAHTTDLTLHLTPAQNTFLDSLDLPTLTAASVNALPAHLADTSLHVTTAQNTFLDALNLPTITAAHVNAIPTIQSDLSTVTTNLSTHAADTDLHLTSAQNTLLDSLTVGAADINRLITIDTYLTSVGSASVASSLATLSNGKINKAGDTVTGTLVMSGGAKITGLPTPTSGTDAVNKDYVDVFVQGIHWTAPVKAATTGPVTLSGVQTVDAVSLIAGDRVLVKDQTVTAENGIYLVASGAWSRAPDYNVPAEITQSAVYVNAGGTANGRGSFIQTATVVNIGDPITYTPFSGPVVNSAGSGIDLAAGGTVSVKQAAGLTFDGGSNLTVDLYSGGGLMTTVDGNTSSTAATAQIALTNIGTAGTYKSVTVDAKGRVTAGTNPTTLAGYGITDAVLKSGDTMTGALNLPSNGLNVGSGQLTVTGGNVTASGTLSTTGSAAFGGATTGNRLTVYGDTRFTSSSASTDVSLTFAQNVDTLQIGVAGSANAFNTHPGSVGQGDSVIIAKSTGKLHLNSGSPGGGAGRFTALSIWSDAATSGNSGFGSHYQMWGHNGTNQLVFAQIDATKLSSTLGVDTSSLIFRTTDSAGTLQDRLRLENGNVVIGGSSQLVTSATSGFLYIPSIGGIPTGSPSNYGNRYPIVVANVNGGELYFHTGSLWKSTAAASSVPFSGITSKPGVSNWNNVGMGAIDTAVGMLGWKRYGNNHVIFDASNGTAPNGTAVDKTNSANTWANVGDSPTLMGWNGAQTYGVRVDTARTAEEFSGSTVGRVRVNGINRGSYGSISVANLTAGYAGIDFTDVSCTFMVHTTGSSGIFQNNNTWLWSFDSAGVLSNGTVPAARVSGAVASAQAATLATKASTLSQGGGSGTAMTFNYNGQALQPTWLWGTNDGVNSYVWNPSNFSVNFATTAGNVSSISNAVGGAYVWTGAQQFRSNGNTAAISSPPLQAYSDNNSGAIMAFHRAGQYAVNMGLDSDNVFRIGGWSATANRLQLDMSGNLTVAGDVTAFSDIRKKKDIEVIDNALARVEEIRGVNFTRIEDGVRGTGVIAQEVQAVLPEAVKVDADGTLSVAYGNMVGLLIEAVKDLSAEVKALKAELAELKRG